jgi:SAM-dependent methyltransferase
MRRHPCYDEVLDRLLKKEDAPLKLLDLGCGFATDLRLLTFEGVDSKQLYGLDHVDDLIKCGYDLFQDKETLLSKFVIADLLKPETVPRELFGTLDIVWAGAAFHLFDYEGQVQATILTVRLLKPRAGSLIFGYQLGHEPAKHYDGRFGHDASSFEKLWKEVELATSSKWEIKQWWSADNVTEMSKSIPGIRKQYFYVERA